MCMVVLPECMYVHSWCLQKSEEGVGSSHTVVTVCAVTVGHVGAGNKIWVLWKSIMPS